MIQKRNVQWWKWLWSYHNPYCEISANGKGFQLTDGTNASKIPFVIASNRESDALDIEIEPQFIQIDVDNVDCK